MNLQHAPYGGRVVGIVALALLGCTPAKPSTQSADKSAKVQTPTAGDTSCPAFVARCERALMSAPIDTFALVTPQDDTLRWLLQADSCAMIILTGAGADLGIPMAGHAMMVGEWYGRRDFGLVWDIAPSPDWRWLAYSKAQSGREIPTSAAKVMIPIIDALLDECYGSDCPLNSVSPRAGG